MPEKKEKQVKSSTIQPNKGAQTAMTIFGFKKANRKANLAGDDVWVSKELVTSFCVFTI